MPRAEIEELSARVIPTRDAKGVATVLGLCGAGLPLLGWVSALAFGGMVAVGSQTGPHFYGEIASITVRTRVRGSGRRRLRCTLSSNPQEAARAASTSSGIGEPRSRIEHPTERFRRKPARACSGGR